MMDRGFRCERPIGSAAPKFPNDLSAHHIHAGRATSKSHGKLPAKPATELGGLALGIDYLFTI
jgi:hypothetical protein